MHSYQLVHPTNASVFREPTRTNCHWLHCIKRSVFSCEPPRRAVFRTVIALHSTTFFSAAFYYTTVNLSLTGLVQVVAFWIFDRANCHCHGRCCFSSSVFSWGRACEAELWLLEYLIQLEMTILMVVSLLSTPSWTSGSGMSMRSERSELSTAIGILGVDLVESIDKRLVFGLGNSTHR